MEKSVVICGYKRSPFTLAGKGALAGVRPDDIMATVVKALVAETGVKADDIQDMLLGCAFPEAEQGFNIARIVVGLAGLPESIGGATVNRFCGSSMTTIQMAAGYLQLGLGEVYIAGGVESMSRIPMGGFNPMPNPAMKDIYPQAYMSMGETAENLAKKFDIDRKTQEEYAFNSHKKAAAARERGDFKAEIVAINSPGGAVSEDGCIRPDTTPETLSGLKPVFDTNGTVTAGTASPLTDGAAAVLVATEDYARKHKLPILARIVSAGVAGCKAEIMGYGPVPASEKALAIAGLTIKDMDLFEMNEAFAVQTLTVANKLGLDQSKVNLQGGALAMGHPLGASGARITGKLAQLLSQGKGKRGLASMCIGGGQGTAIILESV